MSQTWTDNPFASGNVGQTDLQNMENNFLALKSMFSGATTPSNVVAGMPWFDTAQKVLKTRNNDNDGWLGLFHGDASEKRIAYRDAALEGYARDSGVTDVVVALKGGAVYVSGGDDTQGTWTQPNHLHTGAAHVHLGIQHTHTQAAHSHSQYTGSGSYGPGGGSKTNVTGSSGSGGIGTTATDSTGWASAANTGNSATAAAYRPLAATCILISLDLT